MKRMSPTIFNEPTYITDERPRSAALLTFPYQTTISLPLNIFINSINQIYSTNTLPRADMNHSPSSIHLSSSASFGDENETKSRSSFILLRFHVSFDSILLLLGKGTWVRNVSGRNTLSGWVNKYSICMSKSRFNPRRNRSSTIFQWSSTPHL